MMKEDCLPVLFENLKNSFSTLDNEIIWSVMVSHDLDNNWDTEVINHLLELLGEEVDDKYKITEPLSTENCDDGGDAYINTSIPMIKDNNLNSDMTTLKKLQNEEKIDWENFDKDFDFDYKHKSNNGINFSRFFDSLSKLWNRNHYRANTSSNDDDEHCYQMRLLNNDKKYK